MPHTCTCGHVDDEHLPECTIEDCRCAHFEADDAFDPDEEYA